MPVPRNITTSAPSPHPSSSSRSNTNAPSAGTAGLLARQLKEIQQAKDLPGVSVGLLAKDGETSGSNVFEWEVMLMIGDDCRFYGGGNFRASLIFPPTYPLLPPTLRFLPPGIPFHPNIYADGLVCISILHPPEDDIYGYEKASERWNPVQTPTTILLSVISLFHDPNDESPANVEAAGLWRDCVGKGSKEFGRRVRKCVRESSGED